MSTEIFAVGGVFSTMMEAVERTYDVPSVTFTSILHSCPGPRYDEGTIVAPSSEPSLNPFLNHVMVETSVTSSSISEMDV